VKIGSVAEVVQSLQRARAEAREAGRPLARALFFIGAGCSRSAGVPLAAEIARDLVCRLATAYNLPCSDDSADAAFTALRDANHFAGVPTAPDIDWYGVYDAVFQDHYKTPDHARNVFKRAISSARGQINWAHLCLGELVSQGYCSTIVTTNFDLLVLEGMAAAGVIPVVSDGLESLGRIDGDPDYPQLIQLNGSIHTYRLRNKPEEIEAVARDEVASACIRDLVRSTGTIIFIGYAGREKAIMSLLKKALTEFSEKEVYWCSYDGNPDRIGDGAREIMVGNPNARILLKQDADRFFFELCRDIGVGSPRFVRDPLGSIADQAVRVVKPTGQGTAKDIRTEIERLGQLLGSARESAEREKNAHQIDSLLAVAREQRLKGQDKAALETLRPILESADPVPAALADAAVSAFRIAESKSSPDDIAESVRLSLLAAQKADINTPQWAIAQSRLGDALLLAAAGHDNMTLLERSLDAYEKSLSAITKENDPDVWAEIKNNIGVIHWHMFELKTDKAFVDNALQAFDEAQSVRTRRDQPIQWGATQTSKATALFCLGEDLGDVEILTTAAEWLKEALEELTKDRLPHEWSVCTHNLASIYATIGEINNDIESLNTALDLYNVLLPEEDPVYPTNSLGLLKNRADVLASLGEITENLGLIDEAVSSYDSYLTKVRDLGMDLFEKRAEVARELALSVREKIASKE